MRLFTLLVLSLTLFNCSKKDDSNSSNDDEGSTALVLSEATAAESVDLVSSSVESVDDAIAESAGSLAIEEDGALRLNEDSTPLSKYCSHAAEPLAEPYTEFSSLRLEDDGPDRLPASDDRYAARLFHCKMKVDTGSPESVRGVIALPKGLICAFEKEGVLDFDNPGSQEAEIEITDECFSSVFAEQMESEYGTNIAAATIKTEVLDGDTDEWQKKITMTDISVAEEEDMKIEIYLFNSKEKVAMSLVESSGDDNRITTSSFNLTTDGVLRVETKTYRLGQNEVNNRFNVGMRILAVGKMEVSEKSKKKTAKFTAFEKVPRNLYDFKRTKWWWLL